MVIVVSLFYLLFASPSIQESELLGEAIISSVAFSSNLYFAHTSGYFANSSELLPLLHTWSLSVETVLPQIYLRTVIFSWTIFCFTFLFCLRSINASSRCLVLASCNGNNVNHFIFQTRKCGLPASIDEVHGQTWLDQLWSLLMAPSNLSYLSAFCDSSIILTRCRYLRSSDDFTFIR